MGKIIEVKNVTKKYKNSRGIEDVSLTMERGELHVLLGANGAGKSTLMRVIAGLLIPDSGEVLYYDPDTDRPDHGTGDLKMRLFAGGFLIEQPELYGYMTAYDNLLLKAGYYPDGKNSAEEALRAVGLADRRNEKVRNFSTGMKQRLGIAMAMTGRPKYLVLDEPAAGMDIEARADLDGLLQRLKNDGVSILLSTHLVHEAAEIADRITVIHDGRVLRSCLKEDFMKEGKSLEKWYLEQIRASAGRLEAMA
jgi:ABC-2 type transport system ATP-binding protein